MASKNGIILNQTIEASINNWAEALTDRLIEIRFFNVEEMKSALTSHLKMAIYDCIKLQSHELERDYNELKRALGNSTGNEFRKIQFKLAELKPKLREANRLKYCFDHAEEYRMLIDFVKNNFGENAIDRFFKIQNAMNKTLTQ